MFKTYINKAVLTFGMIIAIAGFLAVTTDIPSHWLVLENSSAGKVLFAFSLIFFIFHLAVFIWRIVLFLQYKPAPVCPDHELPSCCVIVPAYNEGRQVFDTIESIVRSNYPADKMSIIGIDDGSADNTWFWLKKAEAAYPGRIQLFRQPVNRGKRHALYRGFENGKGEVFVTIDSDSNVTPDTLRHLVSPFVLDARVGAVAGNVRILNRKDGIIPKMLEVAFAFSFDFLRAGQSVINAVLCTPGALSAYRRDIVLKVLSEWVDQKFCGRAANIGEDRAMTNLILRNGYHVRYQKEAIVYTTSPTTTPQLWKMLLRWARSNVRETLVISRFAFGRFRKDGAVGLRINVLVGLMNMTVGQLMRLFGVIAMICIPMVVAPKLIVGAAVAACAPGLFYAIRHRSEQGIWAIPYSYFWMSCLTWISLYALLTPHKTGWMTRDIDAPVIAWSPGSANTPKLTPLS
ncbi:MAG: glycosyltransferase [Pseudomonadota bacterium]